jgi:uncharacterized protein
MMNKKYIELKKFISEMDRVLVAYSGGVDSTLVLQAAHETLGANAAGLIVKSPTLPARELDEAREIASKMGFTLIELESGEMELDEYTANSDRRCYYCKFHSYQIVNEFAVNNGYTSLLDGNNADDLGDYRPGQQAAKEQSVNSPLVEVGLTKNEIREIARELGLPNWNKPSSACLSSRIPYGTVISNTLLGQIEKAEDFLYHLGFREFRVRHHGDIARIEVPVDEFDKLLNHRYEIIKALNEYGFLYITLDIKGFRSGSMNEGIIKDG